MRHAINSIFTFITTLFTAANRAAATLDNYASWAEAESAAFCEESGVQREARIEQLRADLKQPAKVRAVS